MNVAINELLQFRLNLPVGYMLGMALPMLIAMGIHAAIPERRCLVLLICYCLNGLIVAGFAVVQVYVSIALWGSLHPSYNPKLDGACVALIAAAAVISYYGIGSALLQRRHSRQEAEELRVPLTRREK